MTNAEEHRRRAKARRQRGLCARCAEPAVSYYCPDCSRKHALQSAARRRRDKGLSADAPDLKISYRGTNVRCQLPECARTLTVYQVKRRRKYCSRRCAGYAQAQNPKMLLILQKHWHKITEINRERFLRLLKQRLWAEATEILKPGTPVEYVLRRLYVAEKRGYQRGYNARLAFERRRLSRTA